MNTAALPTGARGASLSPEQKALVLRLAVLCLMGLALTFASSAFVPTSSMPSWLRAFADRQPVTIIVNAVRGLLLNHPDATTILQSLGWCAAILVVAVPLAVRAYNRRAAR